MKKLYKTALSLAIVVLASKGSFAETISNKETLVIMGTTDVHGHIYPYDYYTGKVEDKGLAKIYTKVKELRKTYPNSLLVDSGDFLQGTPLVGYYGNTESNIVNPIIKTMNIMGYDALGVGNHEYDYGLENLQKAKKDSSFPFLSANTYIHGTKKTVFLPYIIKEVKGIKVGIIGFTTPGVAVWDRNVVENKYDFGDIIEAGKKYIPDLRKKCDVLIAIPHSGFESEKANEGYDPKASGVPEENVGKKLADNFPEIDALLLGHTHTEIKEKFENGVLITQADKFANKLSVVKLEVVKEGKKWKVTDKHADTFDIKSTDPDKDIVENIKKYHEKVVEYVSSNIGETNEEWSAKKSKLEDTPLMDLINKVQMEQSGADLSAASLFTDSANIPVGKISIANIAGLYIYENTLYAIKITGKQLKAYLEQSAKYFESVENGEIKFNKKVAGFNYDMVSGVDYKIDLTKPFGSRITTLNFKNKPVTDDMSFTLALNSYRQSGGGGYDMLKNSTVVYNKQESIRELLINYVRKIVKLDKKEIFTKNWEILK